MDPRDFIMGPNRLCPRCRSESLATLSIGRKHVQQCRNCLRKVETDLPQLHKRVIYLDQFAISNMMKALNAAHKGHHAAVAHPLWLPLFDKIDRLRKLQLIVCPSSDEHDRESSFSPDRKALRRMCEYLGTGRSFLPCEQIRMRQIDTAAQAWASGLKPEYCFAAETVSRGSLHDWMDRLRVDFDLAFPNELVEGMRGERDSYHTTMSGHFQVIQKQPPRPFNEWLARELKGVPRGIVQATLRWRQRQLEIHEGQRQWMLSETFPPEAVDWFEHAVRVCGRGALTRKEAMSRALAFIQSPDFARIPFNLITCLINAVVCVRATVGGQKEAPNRGTDADLRIVSTLLPYCDAMFIDNGFRSVLLDIPRPHRLPYPTRVFSLNIADQFVKYLEEIEQAAPADHIARVSDVYGDTWLKPMRRLYNQRDE